MVGALPDFFCPWQQLKFTSCPDETPLGAHVALVVVHLTPDEFASNQLSSCTPSTIVWYHRTVLLMWGKSRLILDCKRRSSSRRVGSNSQPLVGHVWPLAVSSAFWDWPCIAAGHTSSGLWHKVLLDILSFTIAKMSEAASPVLKALGALSLTCTWSGIPVVYTPPDNAGLNTVKVKTS